MQPRLCLDSRRQSLQFMGFPGRAWEPESLTALGGVQPQTAFVLRRGFASTHVARWSGFDHI